MLTGHDHEPVPGPGPINGPRLPLTSLQVLQPLSRLVRPAGALVRGRELESTVEVGLGDQAVAEEEFWKLALMALLLPDTALKLPFVIGDRARPVQVERDGDVGHRHGLRRGHGPANEVLVVEGD